MGGRTAEHEEGPEGVVRDVQCLPVPYEKCNTEGIQQPSDKQLHPKPVEPFQQVSGDADGHPAYAKVERQRQNGPEGPVLENCREENAQKAHRPHEAEHELAVCVLTLEENGKIRSALNQRREGISQGGPEWRRWLGWFRARKKLWHSVEARKRVHGLT